MQAAEPSALPDLVGQDFTADAPNELWYGDITYSGGHSFMSTGSRNRWSRSTGRKF